MLMTKEEAKATADMTAKYLGGYGKLSAMIGANAFGFSGDGSLTFKFKMFKGANTVKFEVNGKDLYDVTFYKVGKYDFKEVKAFNDLYFDQLRSVFEKFTGLYLSL